MKRSLSIICVFYCIFIEWDAENRHLMVAEQGMIASLL